MIVHKVHSSSTAVPSVHSTRLLFIRFPLGPGPRDLCLSLMSLPHQRSAATHSLYIYTHIYTQLQTSSLVCPRHLDIHIRISIHPSIHPSFFLASKPSILPSFHPHISTYTYPHISIHISLLPTPSCRSAASACLQSHNITRRRRLSGFLPSASSLPPARSLRTHLPLSGSVIAAAAKAAAAAAAERKGFFFTATRRHGHGSAHEGRRPRH